MKCIQKSHSLQVRHLFKVQVSRFQGSKGNASSFDPVRLYLAKQCLILENGVVCKQFADDVKIYKKKLESTVM